MARPRGEDYRLYVDNGSGSYNIVSGQTGATFTNNTPLIDLSAKGDTYSVKSPGRPDLTIAVKGHMDLPDANGLEKVYAAATARSAINVQLRKTPFSGSDVIFAASMYVSNFGRPLEDQAGADYSFDLTLNTQPTTDSLT